jgi:hypothetical protein
MTKDVAGLMKYIGDNTAKNSYFSANGKAYLYTDKTGNKSLYVEGVQYIPEAKFKALIETYLIKHNLKGFSKNDVYDMLIKGTYGNGFVVGKEYNDMRLGAERNGTITEAGEVGKMVGLYMAMPLNERSLDPSNARKVNDEYLKSYDSDTRSITTRNLDIKNTPTPYDSSDYFDME